MKAPTISILSGPMLIAGLITLSGCGQGTFDTLSNLTFDTLSNLKNSVLGSITEKYINFTDDITQEVKTFPDYA